MSFLFKRGPDFDVDRDIPDLTGKVIIVTGGNIGLGKETITQLAKHKPAKIYLGARSEEKATAAIKEILAVAPSANILFLQIDLASFSSIKKAAATFLAENDSLHILVNNAGLINETPGLTEDGYELQFGTNYLGPALFTKLLLPLLDKTSQIDGSDVRIINVSSELYKLAPPSGLVLSQDKTSLSELKPTARYGQSKLANIYLAKSYAERYPKITSVALHPGIVRTNISAGLNRFSVISLGSSLINLTPVSVDTTHGALNQLWASTAPSDQVKSGAYYVPYFKETERPDLSADKVKAKELWDWTESEFKAAGF